MRGATLALGMVLILLAAAAGAAGLTALGSGPAGRAALEALLLLGRAG